MNEMGMNCNGLRIIVDGFERLMYVPTEKNISLPTKDLNILGHVDEKGFHFDPLKIEAVDNLKSPLLPSNFLAF